MNVRAIRAIYRFEMSRMFRTVVQSIVAPVLSTSLYFVIFSSAIGSRITEPALLATKATRFPGQELRWDAKNYRFTNHEQANKTILKREYAKGFEPVSA